MKKLFIFALIFGLLISGCSKNPENEIVTEVQEPEGEISESFPEEEPVYSEPENTERPALTYTESGSTYSLAVSEPDFGPEVTYIDYINIVNDRLYASSHDSSDGIFSADFNGKNGLVLENSKYDSNYNNIDDICSAGGKDIFILKTYIPGENPNLRQTAIKADAEGNFIEEHLLVETEGGIPFGSDIIMDKNGNFYLWDYWGKIIVFNNNFSKSYTIDHSDEGVFLNMVSLSNGNAYVTTHEGCLLFDHQNQSFGEMIDVPTVTVFANSGNSEFDFICHDYENLYGYVFEENRLEKLVSFAEHGINPDLLHSADIDENGNITVITKELIWCEPTVYELFYFEKES